MKDSDEKEKKLRKDIGKAYGDYVKQFTPSPAYVSNGIKAFLDSLNYYFFGRIFSVCIGCVNM